MLVWLLILVKHLMKELAWLMGLLLDVASFLLLKKKIKHFFQQKISIRKIPNNFTRAISCSHIRSKNY